MCEMLPGKNPTAASQTAIGPQVPRDEFKDGSTVEIFGSRKENEVILRFPSDKTYDAFLLASTLRDVRVVEKQERLKAVRLGYSDYNDLLLLLAGENMTSISATEAAEIVMKYSDEAGIPGPDSEYGVGILNVGRIMPRGRSGIIDAAITNQRVLRSGSQRSIEVTFRNRGPLSSLTPNWKSRTPSEFVSLSTPQPLPLEPLTHSSCPSARTGIPLR